MASVDEEISFAAWRENAKVNGKIDIANYDDVAADLGITRQEAMLLNGLSYLRMSYNCLCNINDFLVDFHRAKFPERWDDGGTPRT